MLTRYRNNLTIWLLVLTLMIGVLPLAVATAQDEPLELEVAAFIGGAAHLEWESNLMDAYAAEAGITIDYNVTNYYRQPVPLGQLARYMTADPAPDVFTGAFSGGALHNYVEQGLVADISDLWEAQGWYNVFPQSVIDMASYDGRQYFVPLGFQWDPVFYHADIFAEQGVEPPQTWEDLLSVCEMLDAAGIVPFTVSSGDWNPPVLRWFTMLDLRLNGPAFHDRLMRGLESYTDERVVDVFTHWQEAAAHNCFGPAGTAIRSNYGPAVRALAEGDAAMYLLGEWLYESTTPEEEANFDFFGFPVINPELPEANSAEIVHFYGAWLHADAPHPEAGRDLLAHLGSESVQASIVTDLERASAHSAVFDLMPAYQQRGLMFIAGAESLYPLMEVSNLNDDMANRALRLITLFHQRVDQTERLATTIEGLENERLDQVGE